MRKNKNPALVYTGLGSYSPKITKESCSNLVSAYFDEADGALLVETLRFKAYVR